MHTCIHTYIHTYITFEAKLITFRGIQSEPVAFLGFTDLVIKLTSSTVGLGKSNGAKFFNFHFHFDYTWMIFIALNDILHVNLSWSEIDGFTLIFRTDHDDFSTMFIL